MPAGRAPSKRLAKPARSGNANRARGPVSRDAARAGTQAQRELRALPDKHPEDLLDNTLFLVMDIGRLYRSVFDTQMERFGLKRAEWWLIAHLCFFDGCTQQELADIMDVDKGGLAKLISRLEERGLIRRMPDPADSRQKRLYFAADAKASAVEIDEASVQLAAESLMGLKLAEVKEMNRLLRSLRLSLLSIRQRVPFRRRS